LNGFEALTRVISLADELLGLHPSQRPANEGDERLENETAIAACQAILNTGMPIARFRLHVDYLGKGEFTICAITISMLQDQLKNIKLGKNVELQATLWEQTPTGAHMLSGFRGMSRAANYRAWIKQIEEYQNVAPQQVEIPQIPEAALDAGTEEASVEAATGGEEEPGRG
jgi:hypothetical protein